MRAPVSLTSKQAQVLRFIRKTVSSTGRPPTIREIGGHFGFKSTGTTRDYLKNLARKGFIQLTPRQSRAISVRSQDALNIPILGRIVAGMPDLALEEMDGYVRLDQFLSSEEKEIFALKIRGESMVDHGIREGDVAIIRKQKTAQRGDVIAALIENEATVKILEKNKTGFFLKPANPAYPEIHKPFSVLGKVIAILRTL